MIYRCISLPAEVIMLNESLVAAVALQRARTTSGAQDESEPGSYERHVFDYYLQQAWTRGNI